MAGIAPVMKHDEEERAMTWIESKTESEIGPKFMQSSALSIHWDCMTRLHKYITTLTDWLNGRYDRSTGKLKYFDDLQLNYLTKSNDAQAPSLGNGQIQTTRRAAARFDKTTNFWSHANWSRMEMEESEEFQGWKLKAARMGTGSFLARKQILDERSWKERSAHLWQDTGISSSQIHVGSGMFLVALYGIVLISAQCWWRQHLLHPFLGTFRVATNSSLFLLYLPLFSCSFATESAPWEKASNPKLFQTQKLNLVFVFGPISVRSHLVLKTWKLFTISFWNLGNFSPFHFGSLKRGQETGNQRSRTGSRRSRATGSFSHKSRLILKENSPCVSFFN